MALPSGSDFFSQSGPVAQLGARFHGMEEVAGSIPARSTIFNNLRLPLFVQGFSSVKGFLGQTATCTWCAR